MFTPCVFCGLSEFEAYHFAYGCVLVSSVYLRLSKNQVIQLSYLIYNISIFGDLNFMKLLFVCDESRLLLPEISLSLIGLQVHHAGRMA